MDNAASLNQQIDDAITTLKDRGYGGHWFPDSYGNIEYFILFSFFTSKNRRVPKISVINQNFKSKSKSNQSIIFVFCFFLCLHKLY